MIINSLLDTDIYKLSMQQASLHQFPDTEVEYAFKCRNKAVWTNEILSDIQKEIDHLCSLRFDELELKYLASIPWFKKSYIDFLRLFQLNRNHINLILKNNGEIDIRIKGNWFLTILFEVPVLAIVNEVYYRHTYPDVNPFKNGAVEIVKQKASILPEEVHVADFSTRRRFSAPWQKHSVSTIHYNVPYRASFVGTSNVELARWYGYVPIGTMGHEWIQCGQAIGVRLRDSQTRMLQAWVDEYRGNLGIALSDTIGADAFIKDFDSYFAKLYDGVRQDSGDPISFGEKMIKHYEFLKIDPMTKTIIFSDSLTFPKAIEICNHFKGRIKTSFGIGTNITNDIPGVTPLNTVIKVVKCNGQPVAKISDSIGKGMCEDESYVSYLKSVFGII